MYCKDRNQEKMAMKLSQPIVWRRQWWWLTTWIILNYRRKWLKKGDNNINNNSFLFFCCWVKEEIAKQWELIFRTIIVVFIITLTTITYKKSWLCKLRYYSGTKAISWVCKPRYYNMTPIKLWTFQSICHLLYNFFLTFGYCPLVFTWHITYNCLVFHILNYSSTCFGKISHLQLLSLAHLTHIVILMHYNIGYYWRRLTHTKDSFHIYLFAIGQISHIHRLTSFSFFNIYLSSLDETFSCIHTSFVNCLSSNTHCTTIKPYQIFQTRFSNF